MKTLTLLFVIVLSGCATTPQTAKQTGMCEAHGGVHSINSNRPHVNVYCNDGTYHAKWK